MRTYAEWEQAWELASNAESKTDLANELRDRWPDWKRDAPYKTWDDCLQAKMKMTANALRRRNADARKRAASMPKQHGGENADRSLRVQPDPQVAPPAPRQTFYRATDEEKARRRPMAVELWKEGFTRDQISEALGYSHGGVKEDLIAMGIDSGHRPATVKVRAQNREPEGDFRWKNSETDAAPPVETKPSRITNTETVACYIRPASDVIMGLEVDLEELTGDRYELSERDRKNLIKVLQAALDRLAGGSDDNVIHIKRKGA